MSQLKVREKHQIEPILQKLSKTFSTDGERVSWDLGAIDKWTFVLVSSIRFEPEPPDYLKDSSVWTALNACARSNDFSTKHFLRYVREYAISELSRERSRYTVITQINVPLSQKLPGQIPSILGKVNFLRAPLKPHAKLLLSSKPQQTKYAFQSDFWWMKATVSATNRRTGLDHGYENIQFLLGVLNLVNDGLGPSRRMGFPNAPIGKFLAASATVLVDDGSKELGGWLVESQFPERHKISFTARTPHLMDAARDISPWLRQMRSTDFEAMLTRAIILFQEGLSTSNIETALMKFWTCIELLCSSGEKERSSQIIERASSIFSEPEISRMRLEFIAELRNKAAHRGEMGDHGILCAQWGSLYAARIIEFFLFNKHKLRRRQELLDYLSIPLDAAKAERTVRLHKLRFGKELRGSS